MAMDRRDFLKYAVATIAAIVVPLPKLVVAKAKAGVSCGLTLIGLLKRDDSEVLCKIAEVLNETNDVLCDAQWVKDNG